MVCPNGLGNDTDSAQVQIHHFSRVLPFQPDGFACVIPLLALRKLASGAVAWLRYLAMLSVPWLHYLVELAVPDACCPVRPVEWR